MEITKTISTTSKDGKHTVEIRIEITREMQHETYYADGWNIESKDKKVFEHSCIEAFIDGKFKTRDFHAPHVIEDRFNSDAAKIRENGGYARLGDIYINEKLYKEVMEAYNAAVAEASTDEEYAAHMENLKAKEEAERPAKEAREKELKETKIPAQAIEAYNRYRGDEDAAWEDENETAWSLIRRWSPYIEAQQGVHPQKVARLLKEGLREQNYGIQD